MSEKQRNDVQEEDIAKALLENMQEITTSQPVTETEGKAENVETEEKTFRKYKIKDIVFLAIMSACMLVTGAIMPLVTQVPLYGIIQLCLGLQFSIFPVIGIMKVRKPFALIFMSLFCGIFFAFMFLPMFFSALACAFIVEGIVLLIFHGYKRDAAYVPAKAPLSF